MLYRKNISYKVTKVFNQQHFSTQSGQKTSDHICYLGLPKLHWISAALLQSQKHLLGLPQQHRHPCMC